jgi:hypothetical protein
MPTELDKLTTAATRAANEATDLLYPLIYTRMGDTRHDATLDEFEEAFRVVATSLQAWLEAYEREGGGDDAS